MILNGGMVKYKTSPQLSPLTGKLIIPGDKSVSHRALLLAAIAEGDTYIKNLCDGADVASTRHALEQLGIIIRDIAPHQIQVQGQGLLGLKKAPVALDLGNSGTTMRLLPGILVNQSFASTLIGDISLLKRPMQRVIDPLRAVGAQINSMNNGCAPLHIEPITQALQPIDYVLPLASAQVKSCLLLAGLYTAGRSKITEKISTRDHTERLFKQFNIPLYHSQT